MVIVVRGVQIKGTPDRRLEQAVKDLIEKNLALGNIVKISTADIVEMAITGGYQLPSHVKCERSLQLYGYCASILYTFHPNHGTVKKEQEGKSMTYQFIPDQGVTT